MTMSMTMKTLTTNSSTDSLPNFIHIIPVENHKIYKTILLDKIDEMKTRYDIQLNEKGYYYDVRETQRSHLYLYSNTGNTPFNLDGVRVKENPHDSEKSEKFVKDMVKFYNKTLRVIE